MTIKQTIRNIFEKHYVQHILYWLSYLFFLLFIFEKLNIIPFEKYCQTNNLLLCEIICFFSLTVLTTYFSNYYLIKRFLLNKRFYAFFFSHFATATVVGLIYRITNYFYINLLCDVSQFENNFFSIVEFIRGIIYIYFFAGIAAGIFILKYWYKTEQNNQLLVKDKLEAELSFLKAQIHPHFLFNTLNNLYALTLQKSEIAPKMVLTFSEVLHFVLYESNKLTIPLAKEIALIENYIFLEKLRRNEKLTVKYDVNFNNKNIEISPMVLFPFVELAFKQATNSEIFNVLINIELLVTKSDLIFNISYPISSLKDTTGYTDGISIENVESRLSILYTDRYKLQITEKDNINYINLLINLIK